ncbi:hypothetical protein NMG60_11036413 [Bertholletia excelsa]
MLSCEEWVQCYDESISGEAMFSLAGELSEEAPVVISTASADKTSSPTSSGNNITNYSGGQLKTNTIKDTDKDKARNGISNNKPTRRRSRISKKTPITHLNANSTNFRALVQQFTGCRRSSTTLSFGIGNRSRRVGGGGSVTLNFAMPPQSPTPPGFGHNINSYTRTDTYNYQQTHDHQQLQLHQQHIGHDRDHDDLCTQDEQQYTPASSVSSPIGSTAAAAVSMQTFDEFLLDNISLYELIGDA